MKSKALVVLLAVVAMGCGERPESNRRSQSTGAVTVSSTNVAPAGASWFRNVIAESGIGFTHSSGHQKRFWFPEIETGGVGLIDFDRDGLLDILCIDGGSVDPGHPRPPNHRLYRNLGNWKFADVTESAGLSCPNGYGMGCAVGDFDRDGWPDIYITQLGTNHLFRNRGDGTFSDVTATAGVGVGKWSTSAAFFDYDGDGWLDLVVVNYVRWSPEVDVECSSRAGLPDYCSPTVFRSPTMTTLFHNRGNGTFEDVSVSAGLDRAYGNGFGVATGDFDHDGKVDFFVANDATPNQLWLNKGNGRFDDEGLLRGCALNGLGVPRAGMGVVAVDLQQRGWLDLFVTHLTGEGAGLFANQLGNFTDIVNRRGPMAGTVPRTGFGVVFADFDNDGELDLYIANGRVKLGAAASGAADPYAEPNLLSKGLGRGEFEVVRPDGGTIPELVATGRGLAMGDLDNDGGIDLVIMNKDATPHLLRNIASHRGHWMEFEVQDPKGIEVRNAIVQVRADGRTFWRQTQPNEGYCSSHDPRVHFGLGSVAVNGQVWVRWPDGFSESFGTKVADARAVLKRGMGQPDPRHFDW